jgi:hypothetical protein
MVLPAKLLATNLMAASALLLPVLLNFDFSTFNKNSAVSAERLAQSLTVPAAPIEWCDDAS